MIIIPDMAVKMVVFDLDGTLLYTLPDIRGAVNYALSAWDIPPVSEEKMREYVGHGLKRALLSAVADSRKIIDDSDILLMIELMMNTYQKHPVDHTVSYDGIREMLLSLKEKGALLGVLSNKSDNLVKKIVSTLLPEVDFSFVLGQSNEYPLKPDPQALNAMIEKYSLSKEDVIYVGDSEVDSLTADNAGVRKIIVSYGFRTKKELEEVGIYNTVSSVGELSERLFKEF